MTRLFFTAVFLLMVLGLNAWSYNISDYPYKSQYDAAFKDMDDVSSITNLLEDGDYEIVAAALKQVGLQKIVSARRQVLNLISMANPAANQGKDIQSANLRNIFNIGLLTIGKIGKESDAGFIATFLHDTRDPLSIICIMQALGDMNTSKKALEGLNNYTSSVSTKTDGRVVRQLVLSILMHNSRTSINPLLLMQNRATQSQKSFINNAIKKLSRDAKSSAKQ